MDQHTPAEYKFQIYRHSEAPSIEEASCMSIVPFTDEQMAGMMSMFKPGYPRGDETKVLFNMPGFSLTYAWFKADYPLPLHSHDSDCLYYIVSGSLKLGTEELGPREGFFIPDGVPYTYTPGPEGVEVLEFRQKHEFNFKLMAKGKSFWKRAADSVEKHKEDWKDAKRPALNV